MASPTSNDGNRQIRHFYPNKLRTFTTPLPPELPDWPGSSGDFLAVLMIHVDRDHPRTFFAKPLHQRSANPVRAPQ